MRKRYGWIAASVVLCAGIGPGSEARACTCVGTASYCEAPPGAATSASEAIFVGTVESVAPPPGLPRPALENPDEILRYWGDLLTAAEREAVKGSGGGREPSATRFGFHYYRHVVRLRVDEAFVGAGGRTFELLSGAGECCDCTVRLEVGKQYLIVAQRGAEPGSRWTTGGCSATGLAAFAEHEIMALRAWKTGRFPPPPSVGGRVLDGSRRPGADGRHFPASGVRVNLSGPGVQRTMHTRADGTFLFENVPRGVFRLQAVKPGFVSAPLFTGQRDEVDLTRANCHRAYLLINEE